MLMLPMIIMYQPALINQHSDQGKAPLERK